MALSKASSFAALTMHLFFILFSSWASEAKLQDFLSGCLNVINSTLPNTKLRGDALFLFLELVVLTLEEAVIKRTSKKNQKTCTVNRFGPHVTILTIYTDFIFIQTVRLTGTSGSMMSVTLIFYSIYST